MAGLGTAGFFFPLLKLVLGMGGSPSLRQQGGYNNGCLRLLEQMRLLAADDILVAVYRVLVPVAGCILGVAAYWAARVAAGLLRESTGLVAGDSMGLGADCFLFALQSVFPLHQVRHISR